ncbi:hypothetical protein EX895_002498 [Sporisorium graminicola]|uniref:Uncharacterized protein n=1 Tax=Sporisorium graminicola TaxID=280036 RepID=A0A4U7KVH5_9BASI|nr:hypothetical protein EX895_002498 [Sporisorium graminicola]TKY88510.1 hypothetical protein EX895_002498 [Sporisorium graminicola]
MGQSHSKAPSHHEQQRTSHDAVSSAPSRPPSTPAPGWIKIPRSRFISKHRHNVSSSQDVSPPQQHQFIPKQQRQRSVGPIRTRPEPSEYGLRRPSQPVSPLTPSVRIQERRSSRAISVELDKQRRLPVYPVGMTIETSLNTPKRAFGSADTGNLSQSSFTSLAPPVPPSPVPPLRKQRRPSAQAVTRQDRSDSADSSVTASLADVAIASAPGTQTKAASEARPSTSGAVVSAGTGTGTVLSSIGTSSAAEGASTVATSVTAASTSHPALARKGAGESLGCVTLSPALTASGRLSEASDAGTKEILLSDRDSAAAPKMSSDSFVRGPFDEQHPDLYSFYPAGTSLTRPVAHTVPTTTPSPLSRMIELQAESPPSRHVGAVPDLSSPRPDSSHYDSLGRGGTSLHAQPGSFRSFRSTSEGSVRPYRPLPVAPARHRGYSLGLVADDRRDASVGADSYVTADAHSRMQSVDQPGARRIDGLPPSDGHLYPLMAMGMVAAATSPTQYTHSSRGPSVAGDSEGRRYSRGSAGSLISPVAGPRPLPAIPSKGVDAGVDEADYSQCKGKSKRSSFVAAGHNDGPPLSPSAFYETNTQVPFVPTASPPVAPRHSWTSDGAWSASVAAPCSTYGAAGNLSHPERTIGDSHTLHQALAQPTHHHTCHQSIPPSDTILDTTDAEMSRLEKSRSGSRTLPPASPHTSTQLPDSLERAPYADTGVQASLAALRALESPGESLRTMFARQRMFGEPDASVTEMLRDSHILDGESCLDEEEVRAVSGPRRRRRAAPYPTSSDEVSSSGRSLSVRHFGAARRQGRRRREYSGMAEASGTSNAEMSGRGSDSESATLAAVRLVASRARGLRKVVDREGEGGTEHGVGQERPRHQRYVTAHSYADLTGPDVQQEDIPHPSPPTQSASRTNPPSTKHRTPRSPSTPLVAFPQQDYHTATAAAKPVPRDNPQHTRLAHRMDQHHRHRSRSDAHASSTARSSKLAAHRAARRDTEISRYDAQIAELLLLRDKVLQLESTVGQSFTTSNYGDLAYSVDGSTKTARRKSRPSKLGYTVPDIVAWQAGLGSSSSGNAASSAVR